MRSTPKIVVAALASCLLIAFGAVAHAAVAGTPSGEQTMGSVGGMRVAPGAVALCVAGVGVMLVGRRKA